MDSPSTEPAHQRAVVHASGSDAPELPQVRVGFMALTDCASVVMASVLGFDRKYGIRMLPCRQASWAGVRDKLVGGELEVAHALMGLVYGVHLGVSGPRKDMAVLMTLNQNGQGLSLARTLAAKGAVDLASLATLMRREPRNYRFAQTFPTGTHAMWLYYWLASAGIHPLRDVDAVAVPPPHMVAAVRTGAIDGFSAGEPWNHRGIAEGVSVHAAASQDIWRDHPEKVLACTADFAARHPHTARAVTAAVLDASRWIDASADNRRQAARTIAEPQFVNTPVDLLQERMLGHYQNGLGATWQDPHPLRFSGDGAVNYPYLSDGMWFLTQFKRWGIVKEHPDYLAVARQVSHCDLYRQAAQLTGTPLPDSAMRSSRLMDGATWDGSHPAAYADAFAIRAPVPAAQPPADTLATA